MEKLAFTFNWKEESVSKTMDVFDESLDYFQKVFPGGINKLEVCPITLAENLHRIPKECTILAIGEVIEDLDDIEHFPKETVESLIEQTNFTSGLILKTSMAFPIDNEKFFHVDYLKNQNSEWMTLETLEKFRNKIIHLENSWLIDWEINTFLKNLRDGKANKNLEILTIESTGEVDFDEITKGLELTLNKDPQIYSVDKSEAAADFIPFYAWRNIQLFETHDFHTIDGRRVSIEAKDLTCIHIFVWKKKPMESRKRRREEESDGPATKRNN
uniref:FBA_2 domain-containing protein n=1 Tax=Caenorhabditis tropicalis TaxID=1561998 RepID=A0A1I7ULF8_9PELO